LRFAEKITDGCATMMITLNGINYYVSQQNTGQAPLLLLHGFTGSATAWASLLDALPPHIHAIAPDLIGHGRTDSPADPARYRMEHCVADLLALLDMLQLKQVDLLGYSMGGRVALQLAAAAPERINTLILESSSPGLADANEREARAAADNALADSIERDGLAAFVERWERLPLFASQAALPEDVRTRICAQRMRNNPLGLANSLRGMGTGQQSSLWDRLPEITIPTLLIVGELDRKYCAIANEMQALLPNARTLQIANAGHTVHVEQPQVFAQNVLKFLETNNRTKRGR
jgi:2-succinyl-6-hydroxy-2,4-cyclohexadiene-1-carboxylate synthase